MADCSAMATLVNDLAMAHGADPAVKNIDDVVKKIQEEFPEIQRDHVVGAILEVGKANSEKAAKSRLTTGEINSKLQALRSEAKRTSEPFQQKKLQDQIADLQKQKDEGFKPAPARPTVTIETKQLERLAYEKHKLEQEKRQVINDLKPKTVFQTVRQPFDASRAIMTSFDLSMPLRQGSAIVIAHPIRSAPAFVDMFKAFASDEGAHRAQVEINNHPDAPLAAKAGLQLTSEGAVEEAYVSRLVQKIPGIKASGRAATMFMNKLRIDSFSSMIKTLARNGEPTLEEAKAIANYVNVATGKGKLGSMEQAAEGLNAVFFAPKYLASRFQLLAGEPLYHGTSATRSLIAKEYARYAIGMGLVFALGAAAGGTVEKDPRSSDFGKLKFGNIRVDPLAGLSQVAVLISRLVAGSTKSSTTGEISNLRGDVQYGRDDAFDVMSKFIRTKLSPMIGTPIDLATGKNAVGQPVTLKSAAANFVTPLAMKDVYEAIQEQGVPKGTAFGILGLLGLGLQTYQQNQAKPVKTEDQKQLTAVRSQARKLSIGARK